MLSCGKFEPKVSLIMGGVAAGLLLVGVACGAAATATPPVVRTATPTPTLAAVATPVAPVAPIPTPITGPAAKVNPGKLTIMVGDLGSERFDGTFLGGRPGGITMAEFCTRISSPLTKDWKCCPV